MKTRIRVAAIGVPLLLLVIFLAPAWLFAILVGVVCAIAAVEFIMATGAVIHVRVLGYAAASAFFIPFLQAFPLNSLGGLLIAPALLIALFVEAMIRYGTDREIGLSHICLNFFAGGVIPLFLGTLVILRAIAVDTPFGADGQLLFSGRVYVMIPILIAFITDAGGYFAGAAVGKHKLIEKISPKKTVEGAIGGFAAALIGMVVFCLVMIIGFNANYSLLGVFLYSLLGAAVTQFGDLIFSLIKREYGKKDFSNLIPGHGGVLDRFDSMILLAPVITALVFWLPVFFQR